MAVPECQNSASLCRIGGLEIGLWPSITLVSDRFWPLASHPPSEPVPEFTWPGIHHPSLVMMTWNKYDFFMLGMAQFLDCNFDSDEDFEETSRQGRVELFFFKLGETFFF